MVDTGATPDRGAGWQFVPRSLEAPFEGLCAPSVTGERPTSQQPTYYATSFPPELYERLRVFVQIKGWNTLLHGVTIHRGARIVDLGFGDGGNTHRLAADLRLGRLDCVVFGVEKDPNMVERAQESFPRSANPNLIFINGAAEEAGSVLREHIDSGELDLADEPISLVISNYALHWVRDHADPTRFLHDQMFRALNPLQVIGGEQRHFCAHQDAFKELFNAGYDVIRENARWESYFQVQPGDYVEHNEWRHPPLVSKEGIENALRGAGYEGEATLHTDAREFPNVALLKAWVATMIRPFMNRIPECYKADFVSQWIERYLKDTAQSVDGPVKLWDRNLLVVAKKVRDLS